MKTIVPSWKKTLGHPSTVKKTETKEELLMRGSEASSQDLNTVTGQKSVSGSLGSPGWFKLNQRC